MTDAVPSHHATKNSETATHPRALVVKTIDGARIQEFYSQTASFRDLREQSTYELCQLPPVKRLFVLPDFVPQEIRNGIDPHFGLAGSHFFHFKKQFVAQRTPENPVNHQTQSTR